MKKQHKQRHFYGTVTVGEKGQIVIPQEARKNMNLKKGDRLLVFGMHDEMIAIVKLSQVEKIASHLAEKLKFISTLHKKVK